jgi:hypothetical protein
MSSTNKPVLKIDWATHQAANYAVKNWHYSNVLPVPPLVKIGVWENEIFIGVVIFSRGATQNLLKPFGLLQTEGCELTRVALTTHKTPVSRIIKLAIMFLIKKSPSLRLIVSFADPSQNHYGGIYQAGNWIYSGQSNKSNVYLAPDGKEWHSRMISSSGMTKVQGIYRKVWKPNECIAIEKPGKHRYLMPLDDDMKKQILKLSKDYPKRTKNQALEYPSSLGGEIPTCALQLSKEFFGHIKGNIACHAAEDQD